LTDHSGNRLFRGIDNPSISARVKFVEFGLVISFPILMAHNAFRIRECILTADIRDDFVSDYYDTDECEEIELDDLQEMRRRLDFDIFSYIKM
jgi:hypothetical protein